MWLSYLFDCSWGQEPDLNQIFTPYFCKLLVLYNIFIEFEFWIIIIDYIDTLSKWCLWKSQHRHAVDNHCDVSFWNACCTWVIIKKVHCTVHQNQLSNQHFFFLFIFLHIYVLLHIQHSEFQAMEKAYYMEIFSALLKCNWQNCDI